MTWYYLITYVITYEAGYAWHAYLTRRRERRRVPYRWHCPHCTVYVAGSMPVQVAEFTERHLREAHDKGLS